MAVEREAEGRLVRLAIWLALRFAMLGPCRRVVLVRLAGLFGLIVPICHVISPRLTRARKSEPSLTGLRRMISGVWPNGWRFY